MQAPPLRGRAPETGSIAEVVDAVAHGGRALVVHGPAGIGKSSLLAFAGRRARAGGWQVLRAQGVQSEAQLAFAGLHQLLLPVLGRVPDLPVPQRDAMCAAFGMTDDAAPDVFFIGLATLAMLVDAAVTAPVLLLVEDAHWLDRATCDVLAFVARRLECDPVVLLAAVRDGGTTPLLDAGLPQLPVGPLDGTAAAQVLDEHAGDLAPEVRARLLDEAAGNPLALLELPRALDDAHLHGRAALPVWLPLTDRLERLFALRLSGLPAATRAMLLLTAVDDGGGALADVAAAAGMLAGRAVDVGDLTPAVDAGLVMLTDSVVRFQHPLMRSAVYQAAAVAERLSAHAALAEVLADQPDRRVWHRAAGLLGPDAAVADELAGVADRAQRRGGIDDAIAALERSAALSTIPDVRARRLVRAAQLAFERGRGDVVRRLLAQLETLDAELPDRARALWLREMLAPGALRDDARTTLLAAADAARRAGAVDVASDLLWTVAMKSWWETTDDAGWHDVRAALARMDGPRAGDNPHLVAARAYATPLASVHDRIADVAAQAAGRSDGEAIWVLGNAAHILGAFDLGSQLLGQAGATLRAQGRLGPLARVLALQGWSDVHLGALGPATQAAAEAQRLADETGQPVWVAGALVVSALACAHRGDHEQADALVVRADRIAQATGARFVVATVQLARGVAALAHGDHAAAYAALRLPFDPTERAHHPPTTYGAIGDLAEAAVHSGNADQARRLLERTPLLSSPSASPWIRAGTLCALPMLAADDQADARFRASLAELSGWPLHRARLQLAHGAWLRRQRRVAESRVPLRAAREAFDALGAAPWSERARRELRASGETSLPRSTSNPVALTPQELQIAQLAAEGLSNREIGQHLFLSHRTVGSHLYRIFPKLGVSSRSQLHRVLAHPPRPTGRPDAVM